MNREDSTMTSLRALFELEAARLETEREEHASRVRAALAEAERARAAAAQRVIDEQTARQSELVAQRAREERDEAERHRRDLEAALKIEHESNLRALDERFARERAALHASIERAQRERRRSMAWLVGGVAALAMTLFSAGFVAARRMDASIREAQRRALVARTASEQAAAPSVISTVSTGSVSGTAQGALGVSAPGAARVEPRDRRLTSHRPTRPRPANTTRDPFAELSSIDRGASLINGTDR
jgi:hypothetical protein